MDESTPLQAPRDVVTKVHEGIEVQIDRTYVRSWPGLVAAADMQRKDLEMAQRFLAQISYYQGACPNIDEVTASLIAARPGEEVSGNDVMEFIAAAVREDTPKN